MKKTLFLTTLALLAFGCDEGSDNNTTIVSKCGDGFIDVATGEQCEIGGKVEATCQTYDSTKKWKDGGVPGCSASCRLTVGTCEEVEAVCGDGYKNGAEVCDTVGDTSTKACSDLDSTKTWQDGSVATCKADCSGYEVGTCKEAEPATCGDGRKTGAEVCDTVGETRTKACSELDSTKTWKEGSVATCKADCSGYSMDSCVEELCGNGSKDKGEDCDPKDKGTDEEPGTATQTCEQFDSTKKWQEGGSAKCKADCLGYEQNTCKEDTTTPEGGCTKAEDCTGDANNKLKQCIDSNVWSAVRIRTAKAIQIIKFAM